MNKQNSHQNGSIFFLIFLAIGLFAAVSYAVFEGSRGGNSSLTREQSKLAAQEIIAYGDAIATAVQTLRLRGCTDTQIDFSNHQGTSKTTDGSLYTYNTTAPSDGSCDVFSPNGGNVAPKLLSSGYVDPATVPGISLHSQSFVITGVRVLGNGSDSTTSAGTDLVLWLGRLEEDVCLAINKLSNIPYASIPLPIDSFPPCNNTVFNGTYPACANPIGDVATELVGKSSFCNQSTGLINSRVYYRVLIAR